MQLKVDSIAVEDLRR